MSKVVGWGSTVAVIFYVMVGVFGYAMFADPQYLSQLCTKNILDPEQFTGNRTIMVGHFALLFSVICAAPLCVLPQKDTIEELFFKPKKMTTSQNFFVTLVLVIINGALGILIENIGQAMTIVGSTINPVIGFIFPVIFYWTLIKDKPLCSFDKIMAIFSTVFITVISILELVNFGMSFSMSDADKSNPDKC